MKLAASNIAWNADDDGAVLSYMADHGFSGLEIAPTRVFPDHPYEHLDEAEIYMRKLLLEYGLRICSIQSIWYGKIERIAESQEAKERLIAYTKKAIEFAYTVGCENLVFGCPRNRMIYSEEEKLIVEDLLIQCADFASKYHTVIALEPNPSIYNTNYINTTEEAVTLLKRLNHPNLRLNLDFGTIIANQESLNWIKTDGALIHHVHISEPGLISIQERPEHMRLIELMDVIPYDRYFSLEMVATENLELLKRSMKYLLSLNRKA